MPDNLDQPERPRRLRASEGIRAMLSETVLEARHLIQPVFVTEGDWVQDKPQGNGKMRFANGNQYEGQLSAGLPHGKGRMVFPSGDVYEGEFEAGKAHGTGKYAWKGGERYEGAWARGLKHGQGSFHWPSGDRWEGVFKDDERTDDGHTIRKGG